MIVVNSKDVAALPESITRVTVMTIGKYKAPKGWQEVPGAAHMGGNHWLIPLERAEKETNEG